MLATQNYTTSYLQIEYQKHNLEGKPYNGGYAGMIPNLKLAKIMIQLHRRCGRSEPGCLRRLFLRDVSFMQTFSEGFDFAAFQAKHISRCVSQFAASAWDTSAHKSTELSLILLICIPADKPIAGSSQFQKNWIEGQAVTASASNCLYPELNTQLIF